MSESDKMREVFEKWYMTNTFAHVDHLSVFYNDLNCYSTPIVNHCWKAWQAAQSVPVVGEVVAGHPHALKQTDLRLGNSSVGWIGCHTDDGKVFVDAIELERLRKCEKDAERYRWLREQAWNKSELCVVRFPKDAVKLGHDCPSFWRLDSFIDAAIEDEKK